MKGQTSFELLLLVLVTIIFATSITILYLNTQDTTNAYIIIRSEFLLQTNSLEENILLKEVYFKQEERPTFYVTTEPKQINSKVDLGIIEQKINDLTKFNNVEIKLNSD